MYQGYRIVIRVRPTLRLRGSHIFDTLTLEGGQDLRMLLFLMLIIHLYIYTYKIYAYLVPALFQVLVLRQLINFCRLKLNSESGTSYSTRHAVKGSTHVTLPWYVPGIYQYVLSIKVHAGS